MEHLLAKAESLYNDGRFEEALAVCEEALHLSPDPDPRFYDRRATILQSLAEQSRHMAMRYGYSEVKGGVASTSIKVDPGEMSLVDLVESLKREMGKSRRKEAGNDQYGLELFRRAIVLLDDDAWAILQQLFSENVRMWFSRHPARETALRYDNEQSYIDETFRRFWLAVSEQQLSFTTLASVLSYLRLCLNATIMDTLRAFSRSGEESLSNYVESDEEGLLVENLYQENELWKVIEALLPSEKEKRVAYLHFSCNLKPREIMRYCPGEFANEAEIYRLKRNIMERVLRNADKIRWRLGTE